MDSRVQSSAFRNLIERDASPIAQAALALMKTIEEEQQGRDGRFSNGFIWVNGEIFEIFRVVKVQVAESDLILWFPWIFGSADSCNPEMGRAKIVISEPVPQENLEAFAEKVRDLNILLRSLPWIKGVIS